MDVRGTVKVVGVATIRDTFIGVATVQNKLSVGIVSITEDGYVQATSGIVTFIGDGSNLTSIPTSQWTDIDVGLDLLAFTMLEMLAFRLLILDLHYKLVVII